MTVAMILAAIGFVLILFISVANEAPGWASISFAISLVIAQFGFGYPVWQTIVANPMVILGFVALYLMIGVTWSFPKWWFFVRNLRDEYLNELHSFLRRKGIADGEEMPSHLVQVWEDYRRNSRWSREAIPPRASDHKSRILIWMMYWPISMVWTLIDEPFRRSFLFIFERFRGLYQRISESAFSDLSV